MIDVVFLLLIFFMVTTTFSQFSELQINLPEAKGQELKSNRKSIVLTINVDGDYFISKNGERQSFPLNDQLPNTVRSALLEVAGDSRDTPFTISADAKAPYEAVVTVLDVASQLGFSQITFATKSITDK